MLAPFIGNYIPFTYKLDFSWNQKIVLILFWEQKLDLTKFFIFFHSFFRAMHFFKILLISKHRKNIQKNYLHCTYLMKSTWRMGMMCISQGKIFVPKKIQIIHLLSRKKKNKKNCVCIMESAICEWQENSNGWSWSLV